MSTGEERHEQSLEHGVLADDDALELVHRLLEPDPRVGLEGGVGALHHSVAEASSPDPLPSCSGQSARSRGCSCCWTGWVAAGAGSAGSPPPVAATAAGTPTANEPAARMRA